jgi:hypothetical protein
LLRYTQVGADIRASHKAEEGLFKECGKRKNHNDNCVKELIAVPCYANALESDDEEDDGNTGTIRPRQVLVKSKEIWRKVLLKWVLDAWEADGHSEDEEADEPVRACENWLPLPLSKLFGEDAPRPADHRTCRTTFDRKQLLMELLAAEHSSKELDDGELSGSGDDYEG